MGNALRKSNLGDDNKKGRLFVMNKPNAKTAPSYKTVAQLFGERIKAIRESKGYSQLKVAIDVDLNRGYLSEVETGKKEMTLHKMHDLATYYDMTLSELLKGI